MVNMWKIETDENSFSLNEFSQSNLFAFRGNFDDLSLKSEEEIEMLLNENENDSGLDNSQLYNFVHELEINDYILFSSNSSDKYLLGRVSSDYYYNSEHDDFHNFRDVEYLMKISKSFIKEDTLSSIYQCENLNMIDNNSAEDILNVFFLDTPYNPDDYNLEEGLKVILNNYPRLRKLIVKESYRTHESNNLKSFIYNKFPKKNLIPLIQSFDIDIDKDFISFGSHHQGGFPPLTFLTIKYPNENYSSGSSDFYYIVYLFRGDFKGVYLALGLGSSHLNNFDIQGFKEEIIDKCAEKLEVNEFNPYAINLYCNLECEEYTFKNDKKYEESTLFWKYYDFSDNLHFPNDEELKKDLKDYLKLYVCSLENCDFESFKLD